ncbi:LMBR1 domain-containing protein 2 [Choanephora cucurbitarum]|uniref:LMBR1 domain-containing protein 2 n=1 Tax=Choanephora cucurbitarum TaxID=101091 RepID=A0A1C7N009_9FUNG|nr:LMBR1 domain-containing protein 2 [Choanephora cucurbitarum]
MAENTTLPIEPITPPITYYHSDWLPLITATVLLLLVVVLTLSRYGNLKQQAWYVTMACTIGWFFPFWIIFLLPLDLASTVYDDRKGRMPFAYVSESFLFVAWRVLYWTSFCLTWFTIPMLQAYVNTGEFTIAKRIKSAVHVNLRFYSIYVVVGLIGLIYLVFGSGLTTKQGIQSYVMAAANSWGLFLVIVFMGYGLVSVPRSLWYYGKYTTHLHQLYAKAAHVKEECMDSEFEYNELAKTMNAVAKRAMTQPHEIRRCIDTMNRRFPFILHQSFENRGSSVQVPEVLTEDYLVKLSRRMIIAIRMKNRKRALWNNLLNEAFRLQDIIRNKDRSDHHFTSTLRPKLENPSKWYELSILAEWWWTVRIAPLVTKILAVVFSVMSVCIIWSELVFNVRKPATISIVYYVLNACGTNYAILQIRFFNLYILIPNHHTDENSLLWFTGYMCKMMAPLCYNFINFAADAPGASKAVFTTFMGKAEYIKFLGAFADWFPIIILIPSLTLLLNIQGRCLGLCGITSPYQANGDVDLAEDDLEINQNLPMDSDYEEGAALIKEERRLREYEANPATRHSRQSSRANEYINRKYKLTSAPESLRSERDRHLDEILSSRNSAERYRDIPSSSASSVFSGNTDAVRLSMNPSSFGDKLKSKLVGLSLFSASNSEQPSPELTNASPAKSSTPNPPSGSRRVFGRPATNDAYHPYGNNRHTPYQDASRDSSRPTSPNSFLSDSERNQSPFAPFEDVNRNKNNFFDGI